MKILTLGLGSFGFAINKLLGENNPTLDFYFYGRNKDLVNTIKKTREHPNFFPGYKLPQNIILIDDYREIISDMDLIILAIPAQNIGQTIKEISQFLKPGVIILNLAKGIDISTNQTIYGLVSDLLRDKTFNYSVLSGGMLSFEVVAGKNISADLGVIDLEIGQKLVSLFQNKNFNINLSKNITNIELYGSLKNIMAIIIGYYEAQNEGKSTIGKYFVDYLNECKQIISLYGGSQNLDFGYYSLGGDMIATCFGNSRNRYFGELLGLGNTAKQALEILEKENKHSEGYETIKAVYEKIKDEPGFEMTKKFYHMIND
ncbi:NAD(P)-binding domain-containing protein [Candidatus Gracilibacteria bacterium]|nr:NAD(P)-binding domain-containing protein [Candidatus Gracilibacteria bacterium]